MNTQLEKPRQSFWGLWNISFGFFGIQIGFALQNANMSRVFLSLGADVDNLSALWIAAPLTGLLVQPIIGHVSDKTWLGRFGRRRPYFLAGAIFATLALLGMPQSHVLLFSALLLWLLDASLNISMEPFRAFVGDMLHRDQHAKGYAVQTAFIACGNVLGSIFPRLLTYFNVANVAAPGTIPDTVRYSFEAGAAALLIAVLWTVLTTREYSPAEMAGFGEAGIAPAPAADLAMRGFGGALVWIAAGAVVMAAVQHWGLKKEVYLLGGLLAAYGLATIGAILLARRGRQASMLASIVGDFSGMPPLMKRLALVQFFSWFALFIMWVYTTPVIAQNFYGTTAHSGPVFEAAGNWVGQLFAVYNGVAALAALFLLPVLSRKIGKARTHMVCLLAGAAGYASFFVIRDPHMLVLSEVGVGIAWASILAMPYSILASSLPQAKLGIYMGLFNVFVVIPQLLVATVMGSIMNAFFPTAPIWTMGFAAATLAVAAGLTLRIER